MNGLNSPIKRQNVTEWIKKQYLSISCLQETDFSYEDRHYLRVKGKTKILQSNKTKKKEGITIWTSKIIDLEQKLSNRNKEGNYILIKGSVNQEVVTSLNICIPNSDRKFQKKNDSLFEKTQINPDPLIVGEFNAQLSPRDMISCKEKYTEKHQN